MVFEYPDSAMIGENLAELAAARGVSPVETKTVTDHVPLSPGRVRIEIVRMCFLASTGCLRWVVLTGCDDSRLRA